MSLYDFCSIKELQAGLAWNEAVINYLVQVSEPRIYESDAERIEYFGGALPDNIAGMTEHEILKALDRAVKNSAMGRGLLQSLSDSLSAKEHIERELHDREEGF